MNMAKSDPPLIALKKAIKKLENVQRNLGEAGCQDQVWECIRLKESWIAVYERMGGEWNLTDAEREKWAQAVADAQAVGHTVQPPTRRVTHEQITDDEWARYHWIDVTTFDDAWRDPFIRWFIRGLPTTLQT